MRELSRGLAGLLAALTLVLLVGRPAWANFTSNTTASGSFTAATLANPTGFTASCASGTASLSWTGSVTPRNTGYSISYTSTAGNGSRTAAAGTTSRTITSLSSGSSYTFTIKTKATNWLSSGVTAAAVTC